MILEKLAQALPFNRPMKNYYISSTFGVRVDPITRQYHHHAGLDFVGASNEKIISPSSGKVILAGKFSDYGNAVVIDHGYGITTRYGHLSTIKVKQGDFVEQGQVIANQGNTGRSTGAHLHYEVMVNGHFVDPMRVKLARTREIDGRMLLDFKRDRDRIDGLMAKAPNNNAAKLATRQGGK